MQRITEENENLLKRLQDKQSCYNVVEWELDRKKQVKLLKKICYYPPSLVKKSKLRSKRGGGVSGPMFTQAGKIDPNYEVYQYYQQNLKGAMTQQDSATAAMMMGQGLDNESGQEDENNQLPLNSNESADNIFNNRDGGAEDQQQDFVNEELRPSGAETEKQFNGGAIIEEEQAINPTQQQQYMSSDELLMQTENAQ